MSTVPQTEAEPLSPGAAAGALCEMIEQKHAEAFDGRSPSRQTNPRASSIGDCPREMYHQVVDWQQRPAPDIRLSQRFARGNDVESIVLQRLQKYGFRVINQQVPFETREDINGRSTVIVSGTIDCRIVCGSYRPVCDVKSITPLLFDRLRSVRDFWDRGSFWRGMVRQVLVYLFQVGEEWGLILIDDCLGHWRAIPVVLEDWLDEAENALQRCRLVSQCIADEDPPPHIADAVTCTECWCYKQSLCMPPLLSADSIKTDEDHGEIPEILERMAELSEQAVEYGHLEKRVKDHFKACGEGKRIVGGFYVETQVGSATVYRVPTDVKEKYAATGQRVTTTWQRLKG